MPSTVIKSFEYDRRRASLAVTFQNGRRYRYDQVPPATFEAMRGAFSKGSFFNREIRDRFPCTRIDHLAF